MQTIKAVVVGDRWSVKDDAVGMKTALLTTYTTDGYPEEFVPTVSVCREYKRCIGYWRVEVHKIRV